MATNNSDLFNYATDLINFPFACKLIEDAGGYVISTGLVWPIETEDGGNVYYYINVIDREFRYLPDFSADLATAEVVTDQEVILFVVGSIQAYMRAMFEAYHNQEFEIRFAKGESPNLNILPQHAVFFWNFCMS